MVYVPVDCPYCHSAKVIKAGKQANGPNTMGVKTMGVCGGSFSCSTTIEAGYLKSAAR